jgi:hypothetical protein
VFPQSHDLAGRQTHPVSDYFQDWESVSIRGLLSGLGFWLIALVISSPDFSRRIAGDATPGWLGNSTVAVGLPF